MIEPDYKQAPINDWMGTVTDEVHEVHETVKKKTHGVFSWILVLVVWVITCMLATLYTTVALEGLFIQLAIIVLLRYVARMGL